MENGDKDIMVILQKVASGDYTPEQAYNELRDSKNDQVYYTWSEMEEFGRNSFYTGREWEDRKEPKCDYKFKRPTWNGYMRELNF